MLYLCGGFLLCYHRYISVTFDTSAHLLQYEKNEEVQEYFSHMLESMKHQSVFFDLGSILIKPVQRILKYPLLLNELYKVRSCYSFPLVLRVKAACLHLTIKVLLHARVLTLICACPSFKANFSQYNFPNANLRNF